jgi:acetyl-CoA carboxylase biotin carboxylase subunit
MLRLKKVLVANRGEIACRIIRACNELGCSTVAVYSEADRNQPHVRMADEAWPIGPSPARESYLRLDKLIDVARRSCANAVHPGYGFLAENADAAEAFESEGVVWIGPSVKAIRLMGDKLTARETVAAAGLPLVPGTGKSRAMTDGELIASSSAIGFPLLVKAAAGGGGKGMRIIRAPGELREGIRVARLEAEASFGDDRVYLERLITNARHVEIQVLGDQYGNLIHLGERDCSIQRRHQKLIEECPSPAVDEALREKMGSAAVKAAQSVGYYSAGTVEFVLDNKTRDFFFLEMNTRLQVEHTVTERVTGVDIVKEMLRVAAGERLRYPQPDVKWKGSTIECRILAEDPWNHFMPSIGVITSLASPSGPGVRIDTGVSAGSEITPYYDSLIAKLVVWDETREEAIIRAQQALREFQITGIKTTIPFFLQMLDTPEFRSGNIHTKFVEDEFLLKKTRNEELEKVAAVAVSLIAHGRRGRATTLNGSAPASPRAWRLLGRRDAMETRQ